MTYIPRNLGKKLENTVKTFSATYLGGARQCGKSTLVNKLTSLDNANYLTFDTTTIRLAAKKDPEAFINKLPKDKLNIIDEVQRVPNIYLLLKKWVDDRRFEGKLKSLFLLTGSSNLTAFPKLAKAMVGRMAVLTLYPFSTAEIQQSNINFIEKLLSNNFTAGNYPDIDIIKIQ